MALSKKILKPNGIEVSYHKIGKVCLGMEEDGTYSLTVDVNSYVTQDIRKESKEYFVDTKCYLFNSSAVIIENQPIFSIAYNLLKTTADFSDAENA